MKIELEISGKLNQGIYCLSNKCVYKRECANHTSAGDFMVEDGFTPEIEKIGEDYICLTADRKQYTGDFELYGHEMPENYNKLGQGMMTYKDLLIKTCIDYQI